jgi:acetolactate synthase I/III small subunit
VTTGTSMVIEQIKAQLDRLVPVHRIADLSLDGPHLSREMMLSKFAGAGEQRMEALRLAEAFRARVVDATTESLVFEMTGSGEKLDAFTALMRPLGLKEICRTGVCAVARGPRGL